MITKTKRYLDSLKQIDRYILIFVAISIFSCILYTSIKFPNETLMVFGGILYFVWTIFLLFHLGLMFPLFYMCITITFYLSDVRWCMELKEKSNVLYKTFEIIIILIAMFIVYYVIPVIACMMMQNTLNINDGIKLFYEILN